MRTSVASARPSAGRSRAQEARDGEGAGFGRGRRRHDTAPVKTARPVSGECPTVTVTGLRWSSGTLNAYTACAEPPAARVPLNGAPESAWIRAARSPSEPRYKFTATVSRETG